MQKVPRRMLRHERKLHKAGYSRVAGIDESGRGPLAGPVVAACVVLKDFSFNVRIDDSKKLTPKARLKAYTEIDKKASFGIGIVNERIVDQINIYKATIVAMGLAIQDLTQKPDYLLIDGNMRLDLPYKKICIVKGDSKSLSIACASIIAKVTRDRIMEKYHKKYPNYGFIRHKGYGTKQHKEAIKEFGPSPIHRFTFNPIKTLF